MKYPILTSALLTASTSFIIAGSAGAMDFSEKRECTLLRQSHPGLHMHCLVKGGMQGGTLDVEIKATDGTSLALEGPTEEGGSKFLLQHRAAKSLATDNPDERCYAQVNGNLGICLGVRVD